MTQKVNPSFKRPAESFKTSGSVALGGSGDGFVVDGANPTDISTSDGGIDETQLDTFSESHTTTSFDVTIAAGEGFVYGAWLAKDTATTVSLSSSTIDQEVFVGWDKGAANTVIIGTAGDFASDDPKLKIWEFDTDGSGVTAARDYRPIGQSLTVTEVSVLNSIDSNRVLRITNGYSMSAGGAIRTEGELSVDGQFTAAGPIYGSGSITGSGTIASSGTIDYSVEPIDATIDGSTFVAIAGWRTDNDSSDYDAYQFQEDASIEIEQDEQLTLTN